MRPKRSVRMLRPAALLLLAGLGACASVGAVPSKLQGVRTVGIISAVGDELTLTQAGLTGMENSDRSFSIESWRVDDLIVSRAGALLSRSFEVKAVTYRRASFADRERNSAVAVVNLLRDDPIKALVRAEVSPQGLDAYVVITKATSSYGSRGRPIAGIGIMNRSAVFGSYAKLHALYVIRVIDGHTYRRAHIRRDRQEVGLAARQHRHRQAGGAEPHGRRFPRADDDE
jgi:hypothetical protein